MGDPRTTTAWRNQREAWAPLVATGTIPCARCHQPINPATGWHLGHPDATPNITHGVTPAIIAAAHPEHRRCSERSGGALSWRRQHADRPGQRLTADLGTLWPTPT